jgi:hypothetical protein
MVERAFDYRSCSLQAFLKNVTSRSAADKFLIRDFTLVFANH